MKNLIKFFAILIAATANLSWVQKPERRPEILTNDYGIVTQKDLDEEANECGVSHDSLEPCDHWLCLPTNEVFLECIDEGARDEAGATIAFLNFWIKEGKDVHHFILRRNRTLDICKEDSYEFTQVLFNEPIVCALAGYLSTHAPYQDYKGPPATTHHYWQIERLKSHRNEWSYFHREE